MERNSETVVAGMIVSGRNPGRCHEILIGHVGFTPNTGEMM
jgi:hypothetical protein